MTFTAQELREMADGCVAKSQAIISHWHDCQPTSERRNKEVMADVTPLVTQSRMLRYAATLVERQERALAWAEAGVRPTTPNEGYWMAKEYVAKILRGDA